MTAHPRIKLLKGPITFKLNISRSSFLCNQLLGNSHPEKIIMIVFSEDC